MALEVGLYKVVFSSAIGTGFGVVFLKDGQVNGGDSAFAYSGNYSEAGEDFSATVRVFRHSETDSFFSVLGNNDAEVNIEGKVTGGTISGSGSPKGNPAVRLEVKLTKLVGV